MNRRTIFMIVIAFACVVMMAGCGKGGTGGGGDVSFPTSEAFERSVASVAGTGDGHKENTQGVVIDGGEISIVMNDDEIDAKDQNALWEGLNKSADHDRLIVETMVAVDSVGDDVRDVNGSIVVAGGTVCIHGSALCGIRPLLIDRSFRIEGSPFMGGGQPDGRCSWLCINEKPSFL